MMLTLLPSHTRLINPPSPIKWDLLLHRTPASQQSFCRVVVTNGLPHKNYPVLFFVDFEGMEMDGKFNPGINECQLAARQFNRSCHRPHMEASEKV